MEYDFKPLRISLPGTAVLQCKPMLQFCFVGARGVGKSSILASMYHELEEQHIDHYDMETGKTSESLHKTKEDMLNMIRKTKLGETVREGVGIKNDMDRLEYNFTGSYTVEERGRIGRSFGKPKKEFRFPLQFIDMPGGWYYDSGGGEERKRNLDQTLLNSVVSFLAVDTPALMEGDAICHSINKVDVIRPWYENLRTQLAANGHAVVIVLTRCEHYWNNKNGMIQRLHMIYGSMIRKLKDAGVHVYVTYVKTLGGIEFERYNTREIGGETYYISQFFRSGNYRPENCATPLAIALRHGFLKALDALQRKHNTVFGKLWDWAGGSNIPLAIEATEKLLQELETKLKAGTHESYLEL